MEVTVFFNYFSASKILLSQILNILCCRACLDTSFKGNFSECQVLGVYRETFDIGILSEADQLSYTINVHDEGNILEIVTLCSKLLELVIHHFLINLISFF